MKHAPISRRNFLKISAFSASTAAIASLVNLIPAQAHTQSNTSLSATPATPIASGTLYVPPSFSAVPSALTFGAPTDLALGWDGLAWAIDAQGAPHHYDPIQKTWTVFGDNFDAVAPYPDVQHLAVFRGPQYSVNGAAPVNIADTWPNLPDSFKLKVDGAATSNGTLFVFKSGRYINTAQPTTVITLTSLSGWPTTDNWKDGAYDLVASAYEDDNRILLFRSGEYLGINPFDKTVTTPPTPVGTTWYANGPIAQKLAEGVDAALIGESDAVLFQGPAQWNFQGNAATASYLQSWKEWTPRLTQAPSGRVGNLWSVMADLTILNHDGSGWKVMPGGSPSISAGQDGAVYCLGGDNITLWKWNGSDWNVIGQAANLVQVSVGDDAHVWVRDTNKQVHRLINSNGSFSAVNLGSSPVHMTANADGSLWHCDGVAAHAYRHISEGAGPSAPVAVGANVSSVQRVASTGFGTAFCLAITTPPSVLESGIQATTDTTQTFQYESPFVFKTSTSYGIPNQPWNDLADIAFGPGCIYVVDMNDQAVAALDAQTGVELWRQVMTGYGVPQGLIYDATLGLVYFTTQPRSGAVGIICALDGQTGQRRWVYTAATNVAFWLPTLHGNLLCAGDTTGTIHLLDTHAALQRGQQGLAPQPVWGSLPEVPEMRVATNIYHTRGGAPLFVDGANVNSPPTIYIAYQIDQSFTILTAVNAATGTISWRQVKQGLSVDPNHHTGVLDSFVGQCIFTGTTPEPALFVNANAALWVLRLADNGATSRTLAAPQGVGVDVYFSSGMAVYGNTIFVGSGTGTLYMIDAPTLTIVKQTTDAVLVGRQVWSRPVVVTDNQNNMLVFFVRAYDGLFMFDPNSGEMESLGLDQNALNCIVYDRIHGVLYGSSSVLASPPSLGQVFGLRAAKYVQDLRSFIIESQLMQDFDEPADGQSDPPTFARYQTHVSLVDENNAAIPNVSVKIWPDQLTTLSIDGGAPVTVDPNNPDPNQKYVAFQTDGSGSFTIHSGSLLADGSDAPDFTAPTMRFWAGFMDVNERITVAIDAEFHQRLNTTQAVNQGADSDHPNQVNLQNAQDYPTYSNGVEQPGDPLFTDDEKNAGMPAAAASAIQSTLGSISVTGGTSGGSSMKLQSTQRRGRSAWTYQAGAASLKYAVADYNLPGLSYQFANTPMDRSITPVAVTGFSLINGQHTSLSHSAAADAIDALGDSDLQAIRMNGPLAVQFHVKASLKEAWKDIKKAGTKVTHAIVSVAKDVYVGIRYVANGIVNVAKAVAHDVEDAMATVGSFFAQLGKDFLKVLRAISMALNFKHVITTYNVIRSAMDDMLGSLAGDLKAASATVDQEFTNAESRIENLFCNLINKVEGTTTPCPNPSLAQRMTGRLLGGKLQPGLINAPAAPTGTPISQMPSVGSTPHSLLTVSPVGTGVSGLSADDSGGQSQAVQGMWGAHKVRQNGASATTTDPTITDALSEFATSFYARLSDDLSGPLNNTRDQFLQTFKAKSASEFFADAIGDVLSVFEVGAVGAVSVVHALVGGVLGIADDVVSAIGNNGTIKIPVLSTLWKMITGKPLEINLADLFALILAMPVTYTYRIMEGTWITPDGAAISSNGSTNGVTRTSFTPQTMQNIMGLVGAYGVMLGGVLSAVNDSLFIFRNGINLPGLNTGWIGRLLGAEMLIALTAQNALGFFKARTTAQLIMLAIAGAKVASAFALGPIVQKIAGTGSPNANQIFVTSMNFLLSLVAYAYVFLYDGSRSIEFMLTDIFFRVPDSLGPLKFAPAESLVPFIVPAGDLLFLGAAAGLSIFNTIKYWKTPIPAELESVNHYYFPWVSK